MTRMPAPNPLARLTIELHGENGLRKACIHLGLVGRNQLSENVGLGNGTVRFMANSGGSSLVGGALPERLRFQEASRKDSL